MTKDGLIEELQRAVSLGASQVEAAVHFLLDQYVPVGYTKSHDNQVPHSDFIEGSVYHWAASQENIALCKYVFEHANKSYQGHSTLQLFSPWALLNAKKQSALYIAAKNRRPGIRKLAQINFLSIRERLGISGLKEFYSSMESIEDIDTCFNTLLVPNMFSSSSPCAEVMEFTHGEACYLIDYVNTEKFHRGEGDFKFLIKWTLCSPAFTKLLIERGVDVNTRVTLEDQDEDGLPWLTAAMRMSLNPDVIIELLDNGASRSLTGIDGNKYYPVAELPGMVLKNRPLSDEEAQSLLEKILPKEPLELQKVLHEPIKKFGSKDRPKTLLADMFSNLCHNMEDALKYGLSMDHNKQLIAALMKRSKEVSFDCPMYGAGDSHLPLFLLVDSNNRDPYNSDAECYGTLHDYKQEDTSPHYNAQLEGIIEFLKELGVSPIIENKNNAMLSSRLDKNSPAFALAAEWEKEYTERESISEERNVIGLPQERGTRDDQFDAVGSTIAEIGSIQNNAEITSSASTCCGMFACCSKLYDAVFHSDRAGYKPM